MRLCCVTGCFNSEYKLGKWREQYCVLHQCNFGTSRCICNPPFVLHPFPSILKDPHKRSVWIKNINRMSKDGKTIWTPTNCARVCSRHFIDNEPTQLNPYPTLHLGHVSTTTITKSRLPPLDRSVIPTPVKKRKSVVNESESTNICHPLLYDDHDYFAKCKGCIDRDQEIKDLKIKIQKLQAEKQNLLLNFHTKQIYRCDFVFKNDKSVKFYTGIPSIASFNAILKIIEPKIQKARFWKGPKHFVSHVLNYKKKQQMWTQKRTVIKGRNGSNFNEIEVRAAKYEFGNSF